VLYETPRHFYRIGACRRLAKSCVRPQLFAYQRQSITEKVGLDFLVITSVCGALAMIVAYPFFLIGWTKSSSETVRKLTRATLQR
jgi:hypothetical protein